MSMDSERDADVRALTRARGPCSVDENGTPPPAAKRQAVASPRGTVEREVAGASGVKPARRGGTVETVSADACFGRRGCAAPVLGG